MSSPNVLIIYPDQMRFDALGCSGNPLIIRHPANISDNRVVDQLVDPGIDTMPTLLDLCNIPIPSEAQGASFASKKI